MSWIHLEDSTPVARKPYRCYLCDLRIEAGERHVKRAGINDDGLCSVRMHAECCAMASTWDEDAWECIDASEVRLELAEYRAAQAGKAVGS